MTLEANTLGSNGLRGVRSSLNAYYQTLGGYGVNASRSRSETGDVFGDHAMGKF